MSKSKQKGTAAETAVVRYLRQWPDNFGLVERRALSGGADKGDIAGVAGWAIEVKAAERLELAKWQRETLTEMANAGVHRCLLIVKRKYKPVGEWDAYIPARQLGHAGAFVQEDSWVRMDLALAASYMTITNL